MVSEIAAKKSIPLKFKDVREVDTELDRIAGPGHPVSSLKPGTTSTNSTAIVGEQGYFFIGNGTNHWEEQYLGQVGVSESWISSWHRLFEMRQVMAAKHGVKLYNFVAPEKQVLLPHLRWPGKTESGERRPFRLMEAALPGDAQLIYPEDEMRAASEDGPIFYRHNSQWSPSGCYAGMRVLLDHMGTDADIETLPMQIRLERDSHDLTMHFFDNPPVEEILSFSPSGSVAHDNQQLAKTGQHTGSVYALFNENAPDSRKVMIFGDSYSYDAGIAFVLSAVFRTVIFLWSKDIIWDVVAQQTPDIVLWESAERYMISIPSA